MVAVKPSEVDQAPFQLELRELGTEIWEEEIDEETVVLYKERVTPDDSEKHLSEDDQQVGSQRPSTWEGVGPAPYEESCEGPDETALQKVIDANKKNSPSNGICSKLQAGFPSSFPREDHRTARGPSSRRNGLLHSFQSSLINHSPDGRQ